MSLQTNRRRFLTGLGVLLTAPAIVRVASLMPVKAPPPVWSAFVDNDLLTDEYLKNLCRSIQIMKERALARVLNAPTELYCRPMDVEDYRAMTPQGRIAAAPGVALR
jgi:hypothetical protein